MKIEFRKHQQLRVGSNRILFKKKDSYMIINDLFGLGFFPCKKLVYQLHCRHLMFTKSLSLRINLIIEIFVHKTANFILILLHLKLGI